MPRGKINSYFCALLKHRDGSRDNGRVVCGRYLKKKKSRTIEIQNRIIYIYLYIERLKCIYASAICRLLYYEL